MSIETLEQAIGCVLKYQKSFIVAEGDAEAAKQYHKRIENMGFGVKEEARVDELFGWIERIDQATIEHMPANQSAYDLLKNDEDLFLV
jgi:hypothetical protein